MFRADVLQRVIIPAILVLNIFAADGAYGIIWHPEAEPNLATWRDRPDDNIAGRWITDINQTHGRASCVVVSPNYIITTRHQGGGTSSVIQIDDVSYSIDQIWNHPNNPNPVDPNYNIVDLRVVKLHSGNLSDYVPLYTDTNELESDVVVIGGYGVGREAELESQGKIYGYSWQDSDVYRNYTQRWCTNRIDDTWDNVATSNYNLDLFISDFDGLDPSIDDPCASVYEGSVAGFDSGCGWYIHSDGQWKVAGLSWGVEHSLENEAWFRNKNNPNQPDPDIIYTLRISSYADWIASKIEQDCSEPVTGDFNGDCVVDVIDFSEFVRNWLRQDCAADNNYCEGSDFEPDGNVDLSDFAVMTSHWLSSSPAPEGL